MPVNGVVKWLLVAPPWRVRRPLGFVSMYGSGSEWWLAHKAAVLLLSEAKSVGVEYGFVKVVV